MDGWNGTFPTYFIFVPITNLPWLQKLLFVLVLILYTLNITGNLTILTLVVRDVNLHSPMYFLLACLSFVDIGISTVTVPKLMAGLWLKNKISVKSCFTQMFFFHIMGSTEGVIIAVMGFDRYVAICHPLRYVTIMRQTTCIILVSGCMALCLAETTINVVMTSRLSYCRGYEVRHFFCDIKPVLKLACADTRVNELVLAGVTGGDSIMAFVFLVLTYGFITKHIFKIQSSEGRSKAFSTCSSHFVIVMLYYGTAICIYSGPASLNTIEKDKVASMIFTIVTPALNPLIYTLRNKDIIKSIRKFSSRSHIWRVSVK